MLILSRDRGTSIMLGDACIMTLVEVSPHRQSVSALVVTTSADLSSLKAQIFEIAVGESTQIGNGISLSVTGVVDHHARIGVECPKELSVHRLEVYEAIRRENRAAARGRHNRAEPDDDEGTAGAPVPRPSSPRPPGLDVRLTEPSDDDPA